MCQKYGLFLGSEKFVNKWKKKIETEKDREKPQARRALKDERISVVAERVFASLGVDNTAPLLKPRRGENRPERDLAIYVICHLGVFTHQEIGRQFGVGYTSISGALKRVEGYMGSDTELRKRIDKILNDK